MQLMFYMALSGLRDLIMPPIKTPRLQTPAYMLTRLEQARSKKDGRIAHHQPPMKAQRVPSSMRYRSR